MTLYFFRRSHDNSNTKLDKAAEEDLISDSIIQQINRVVLNNLSSTETYIMDAQVNISSTLKCYIILKNDLTNNTRLTTIQDMKLSGLSVAYNHLRPAGSHVRNSPGLNR